MKTVTERLTSLRTAMTESGCDIFIIPSSDAHANEYIPAHDSAYKYFSGFSCENTNLLIAQTEAAMWVDGRFFGAADQALQGTGIASMHLGVAGVPTLAQWLTQRLSAGMVLGYCAQITSLNQKRMLEEICHQTGASMKDLPLIDQVWVEDRPAVPSSPAWLLDVKYAGFSPAQKLEMLRSRMAEADCTATLLNALESVAWVLNLRAADLEDTPYALAYCYVDTENAVLFIDDSRLDQDAANTLKEAGVSIQGYHTITTFLSEAKKPQTILIDPGTLNAALDNALHSNDLYTIVEGTDLVNALKAVKNETELACTRQAHLYDGAAMVRFQMELERRLSAGEKLRETDIDAILHKYRSANPGFLTESFPTIAAYGKNAANMHYEAKPGADAEIQPKGYLLVDSGATYYTGTTDITRTYVMGELTEEEKLSYTRTLRCHIDVAMAVWKEGATGGELDMIARQPLWRHMLDYRCGTGHGVAHVGIVHEKSGQLRPHNSTVFLPGMIVTDEPGVYEEGKAGIRIENELICTKAGTTEYGSFLAFEPLTFVPIELSCVLTEELTREEKQWINAYHAQVLEKLQPLLNDQETEWLRNKCREI